MGNHAYLKKGQQDTSRSQQKVPSILLSFFFAFFLIFQFFSNSFCFFFFLPKCQISLARDAQRRIAEPQILRWMTQAENPKCIEMHYPSLSQSIHVGHVSHVLWKRLVTCACSSPDVRQNGAGNVVNICQYMSIYVNMGMMKCKCKYNMFCTSYKTLINVLYLLGITTECVELPLVWTMPFTWTFLRFSISTWTRLTRQWFCEYRSRTFIVLIWICYKDIVAQCRAGTKQLCDPTRIVNYCLLF